MKLASLFGLIAAAMAAKVAMDPVEVRTESLNCGANRFDRLGCLLSKNCFYVDWYVDKVKASLPFCLSYNEISQFYIRDPDRFLAEQTVLTVKQINRESFCALLLSLPSFLGAKGTVENCQMSSNFDD